MVFIKIKDAGDHCVDFAAINVDSQILIHRQVREVDRLVAMRANVSTAPAGTTAGDSEASSGFTSDAVLNL